MKALARDLNSRVGEIRLRMEDFTFLESTWWRFRRRSESSTRRGYAALRHSSGRKTAASSSSGRGLPERRRRSRGDEEPQPKRGDWRVRSFATDIYDELFSRGSILIYM